MKSADEWLIYAYEAVHSSEVAAQSYAIDWDAQKGGIPQTTRPGMRPGQSDVGFTRDLDLKRIYLKFIEEGGVDARAYTANCLGHSIKLLAEQLPLTFPGEDTPDSEWKVRQSIERGRSEWGNTLRSVGIRSTWEATNG